jgi:UPF0042 nucleotide-binding protein
VAEAKPVRARGAGEASEGNQSLAAADLVIITGMSGSGKLTTLKAFEDLGFYAVDNLPIALVPKFADLTHDSKTRRRAALIIDVREGSQLRQFPRIFADLRKQLDTRLAPKVPFSTVSKMNERCSSPFKSWRIFT